MPKNESHKKAWINDVEEYLPDKLNGNLEQRIVDFNDSSCFLQVKIPGFCKVFLAATQ
jgi:hypothetical protein